MIVKNENAVITRCLASVKPLINYWIIVDTGSTDGTQDIIRKFLHDIPGQLYERPWVNFAHNRNEALTLASKKGDYVLFIDADEVLLIDQKFKLPELDKDYYYIKTNFSDTIYDRVQLINNHLDWEWVGVLHENLQANPPTTNQGTLSGITNFVRTDGYRSQDPQKFERDAEILEKALLEEPTNSRYVFYLAQSYRDAQQPELALKNYQKRVKMEGWDQEIFWSLLQIGILQEILKIDPIIIANSYLQAYLYRPTRAEPLYRLARFHRLRNNYLSGYQVCSQGLCLTNSTDNLFVEKWIYDYGLLLEFSICAYWIGKYQESLLASYALLANPALPSHIRQCVEKNLVWVKEKYQESHRIQNCVNIAN